MTVGAFSVDVKLPGPVHLKVAGSVDEPLTIKEVTVQVRVPVVEEATGSVLSTSISVVAVEVQPLPVALTVRV